MKTNKTRPRSRKSTNSLRPTLTRALVLPPPACAFALALGMFSAGTASAEVIAGWDTWVDSGSDNYNATDLNGATGLAVGTASAGVGWANWTNATYVNGASADGTWGTSTEPGADTSTATNTTAVGLLNATASGEMTFSITNTSGTDKDLTAFHFDGTKTLAKAAGNWSLSILAGSDVTVGAVTSGTLGLARPMPAGGFDIDLTGLADRRLEDGGTVIFELALTGGAGDGAGGHNAMIDNVALTGDIATDNKLVITAVPASASAGSDFSVTVQVQDGVGAPVNVTQDTGISLGASGSGILSGNTATILSGTDSVTLNTVQYTKAEAITLIASRTSGDIIAGSDPSSSITIDAGPASQLIVETAADGTGVPVAAQTIYPTNSITVYAISRDAFDNFVANETATWSLANITGNIVSGDLVDNTNGSATFTANDLGTANIRASFGALPDADSGLITVEEFVNRFTGGGGNGSWQTALNWNDSVLPDFDNATDLFFSAPTNTKGSPYLGANVTVRSLTYDIDSTASFNTNFVLPGNVLPANLTFDTDSTTGPAEINIDAAFTSPVKLGFFGSVLEENIGEMILADDLLVTHEGSASFTINASITGSGGLAKAGTGNLVISGTNTYTGDTVVNAGTLTIDGDSIEDTGTLVINGGIVNVTGTEVVAVLDLGSGPVTAGETYGATGSDADNIDDTKFSGDGVVSVVIPASGYASWATANAGGQTAGEDFNLDGVDNGIAYFMNNPGRITLPGIVGGAVTWTNGGNIPSSAYGTEFVVQTSQDLSVWTPVDAVDLTTNDDTTLTYTPPMNQGNWFVRLVVTPN